MHINGLLVKSFAVLSLSIAALSTGKPAKTVTRECGFCAAVKACPYGYTGYCDQRCGPGTRVVACEFGNCAKGFDTLWCG